MTTALTYLFRCFASVPLIAHTSITDALRIHLILQATNVCLTPYFGTMTLNIARHRAINTNTNKGNVIDVANAREAQRVPDASVRPPPWPMGLMHLDKSY